MNATNLQRVHGALTDTPKKGHSIAHECGLSFEATYAALVRLYDRGQAFIRGTGDRAGHDQGWCL